MMCSRREIVMEHACKTRRNGPRWTLFGLKRTTDRNCFWRWKKGILILHPPKERKTLGRNFVCEDDVNVRGREHATWKPRPTVFGVAHRGLGLLDMVIQNIEVRIRPLNHGRQWDRDKFTIARPRGTWSEQAVLHTVKWTPTELSEEPKVVEAVMDDNISSTWFQYLNLGKFGESHHIQAQDNNVSWVPGLSKCWESSNYG